jgi:cysteinyl-tRNA synthetase
VAVRLFYLRSRYREPFDFTEEGIEDAIAQLDRLWAFRRRAGDPTGSEPDPGTLTGFREAMDDDFNTAGALGVLFEAVRAGNRRLDAGEDAAAIAAAYDEVVTVLGIAEPAAGLDDLGEELVALGDRFGVPAGDGPEPVLEGLIARREAARSARDWATADAIRDALEAAGVVVEDTADGARWHRG